MKIYYVILLFIIVEISCSTIVKYKQRKKNFYTHSINIKDSRTKKNLSGVQIITNTGLLKETGVLGNVVFDFSCYDSIAITIVKGHYKHFSIKTVNNCEDIYDTIHLKEFDFPIEIHDVFPDSLNPNKK